MDQTNEQPKSPSPMPEPVLQSCLLPELLAANSLLEEWRRYVKSSMRTQVCDAHKGNPESKMAILHRLHMDLLHNAT